MRRLQEKIAAQHRAVIRGAPPFGVIPAVSRFDMLALRNSFGWSQEEMGYMLGETRQRVAAMEKGTAEIPAAVAWAISHWEEGYRRARP